MARRSSNPFAGGGSGSPISSQLKPLPPVESSLNLDVELRLPLDDAENEGGVEIDFIGIDEDLERFQKDDIVRQALSQGVDLRGYARDIETELREVRIGPSATDSSPGS